MSWGCGQAFKDMEIIKINDGGRTICTLAVNLLIFALKLICLSCIVPAILSPNRVGVPQSSSVGDKNAIFVVHSTKIYYLHIV